MTGIYKPKTRREWFAGDVNSLGEPLSSGPGSWAGYWFDRKRKAEAYLRLLRDAKKSGKFDDYREAEEFAATNAM